MDDPILSKLYYLKPSNAISSDFREKVPSLLPLMNLLPRITNMDEKLIQSIDDEWRNLPLYISSFEFETKSPDSFWYVTIV